MLTDPKISDVLNNTPVHAVTPEIKIEVLKFADDDHYDNGNNKSYNDLKDSFALFYGFEIEYFNWKKFGEILKHYNAFDTQIIMGPVLRAFMKDTMQSNIQKTTWFASGQEQTTTPENYIKNLTEINTATGCYSNLNPDELFYFICSPLGLNLSYTPQNIDSLLEHDDFKPEDDVLVNLYFADARISTVNIYQQSDASGRWERTQNGENSFDYEHQEDTQLTDILPSLNPDQIFTQGGIDLLKKQVGMTANAFKEGIKSDGSKKNSEKQKEKPSTDMGEKKPEKTKTDSDNAAKSEMKNESQKTDPNTDTKENQPNTNTKKTEPDAKTQTDDLNPENENNQNPPKNNSNDTTDSSTNNNIKKSGTPVPLQSIIKAKEEFDSQLNILENKIENNLKPRLKKHPENVKIAKAVEISATLYQDLKSLGEEYFSEELSQKRYQHFRAQSAFKIEKSRSTLEQYRGWHLILINLALAIAGLGVAYLIAASINKAINGKFLFFTADTAKKVKAIEQSIINAEPALKK